MGHTAQAEQELCGGGSRASGSRLGTTKSSVRVTDGVSDGLWNDASRGALPTAVAQQGAR
jgi:hypothetical protein